MRVVRSGISLPALVSACAVASHRRPLRVRSGIFLPGLCSVKSPPILVWVLAVGFPRQLLSGATGSHYPLLPRRPRILTVNSCVYTCPP
ncbi:hypothetical protein C8R46DRAFT_1145086 [Mycena filopes]|nr:hypothetical protein C8R46DRAFT_1145086 [Mycena filopes]